MNDYKGHIAEVLHYINQQIRRDWTGADSNAFNKAVSSDFLAKIACMSSRNFQLYFNLYLKETFGAYINRIRLEVALQLLTDGDFSNSEIAERIGYANDTALYNALNKKYNTTPTLYKNKVDKFKLLSTIKTVARIENFKEKTVLFLPYIGSYNNLSSSIFEEESWDKLYDYASIHKILPFDTEYWGICYDNTNITDSDKCRFYACLMVDTFIKTKLIDEIKCMVIPSAKYAVFTYIGDYGGLDAFYNIAIQNIPEGYQLSDDLILEHYVNNTQESSTESLVTELWIPIVES